MSRSELHDWECEIEELSGNNADKMLDIAQDIYKTAFVRGRNSMTWEQTKWIPVSEKLPKEGITVIGINLFGDIYKSECYNDCGEIKWYADGDYDVPIVAWLPFPKPYKAESEENND